jgi:predicted house-cleaning noncanonical NTP pyrophosphatase (MazG superfamily)
MNKEKITDRQERLAKFMQTVKAAQKLQDDILKYGLDAAYFYVEDVEGDWLEKWGDEEEQQTIECITSFLKSDDWLAIKVCEHLKDKSLYEFAVQLEKSLILSAEDRLFVVKKLLTTSATDGEKNWDCRNEYTEVYLQNLAAKLVEKLVEILQNYN